MKVRDALATLETIAPLAHAQSWDNVGLFLLSAADRDPFQCGLNAAAPVAR